ncbi:unnamed protein product [Closterium sp. NIES-65]|nr:unnamed protein product [Closterium sp. NIES-65]
MMLRQSFTMENICAFSAVQSAGEAESVSTFQEALLPSPFLQAAALGGSDVVLGGGVCRGPGPADVDSAPLPCHPPPALSALCFWLYPLLSSQATAGCNSLLSSSSSTLSSPLGLQPFVFLPLFRPLLPLLPHTPLPPHNPLLPPPSPSFSAPSFLYPSPSRSLLSLLTPSSLLSSSSCPPLPPPCFSPFPFASLPSPLLLSLTAILPPVASLFPSFLLVIDSFPSLPALLSLNMPSPPVLSSIVPRGKPGQQLVGGSREGRKEEEEQADREAVRVGEDGGMGQRQGVAGDNGVEDGEERGGNGVDRGVEKEERQQRCGEEGRENEKLLGQGEGVIHGEGGGEGWRNGSPSEQGKGEKEELQRDVMEALEMLKLNLRSLEENIETVLHTESR